MGRWRRKRGARAKELWEGGGQSAALEGRRFGKVEAKAPSWGERKFGQVLPESKLCRRNRSQNFGGAAGVKTVRNKIRL